MKRFRILLFLALCLAWSCDKITPTPEPQKPLPTAERNGESGITYQLLVYSFADSNGDGIGDFRGIESKLDYLSSLGVHALWLSPVHPSSSYHGYDVEDYYSLNPDFGTEADFKSLIDAARAKGIKVYLDFVLNHTASRHPWFLDAKSNPNSPYRDYYIFSDNPSADIAAGKIAQIATEGSSGYDAGQWFAAVASEAQSYSIRFTLKLDNSGKPLSIKAEQTESIQNTGSNSTGVWLYYGNGLMQQFYRIDATTLALSLSFQSDWGVLVRTSQSEWGSHKYGGSGNSQLEWGKSLSLNNSTASDILLPGMTITKFHSHFWTNWFADLNYGPAATADQSPAFQDVCAAADKWINMGVDGFRLDAIKHIYHNANTDENPTFLRKFYDHCNATYHARGGSGDIYMIGEQFSEAREVAPYYKGLPAFFEFSFWWRLKDAINDSRGSEFVSNLQNYRSQYERYRPDFIEATKLTNHDEDRAASDLGKNPAKIKLAASVLLTACGQPYIYQGEELGYYGTKSGGDEYVRSPMLWTKDPAAVAKKYLNGKYSSAMLTPAISVEAQSEDSNSILETYRRFGIARDSYKALSQGSIENCSYFSDKAAICAFFRTYEDQRLLIIHNFSSGPTILTPSKGNFDSLLLCNGNSSFSKGRLTLGPYSTAIYIQ